MTSNPQPDPTAAIEVLARLLCAADSHVYGNATWQQLSTTVGRSVQDGYRDAARWLLPRMTVATKLAVFPEPPSRAAEELAKRVTRAIFALKTPTPPGSEHYWSGWDDGLEAAIDAARDAVLRRVANEEQPADTCGRTKSVCGTEYPPCARPAGHEEAYCRSADGNTYFLAVGYRQPAAADSEETRRG